MDEYDGTFDATCALKATAKVLESLIWRQRANRLAMERDHWKVYTDGECHAYENALAELKGYAKTAGVEL